MSGGESKPRELLPEEISTALDWLDGELEAQAATEFEARMTHDGELARQVEALARMDTFMARNARVLAGSAPKRSRVGWWLSLAAAVLVAGILLEQLFESTKPECEVALAPGYALAEDWLSQQPGLEGVSAPGIAISRGSNSKPMSAEDFLRESEQAETAVVTSALAQHRRELEAGWFVVPIELDAPSWVMVLGFPETGKGSMLFPRSEAAGSPRTEAYLARGRSILPSDRAVESGTPGTLEYRPGFLVPLGSKQLTVLVAARNLDGGITDSSTWIGIESWLANGESVDRVAARLSKLGFTTRRLSVREPK